MKKIQFDWLIPTLGGCVIVGALSLLVYGNVNAFNPNSRFCDYKIYKTADGKFEVWNTTSLKHRIIEGATYEQAKECRIEQCKSVLEILNRKPTGEEIK
jgi:hypothetical protein